MITLAGFGSSETPGVRNSSPVLEFYPQLLHPGDKCGSGSSKPSCRKVLYLFSRRVGFVNVKPLQQCRYVEFERDIVEYDDVHGEPFTVESLSIVVWAEVGSRPSVQSGRRRGRPYRAADYRSQFAFLFL